MTQLADVTAAAVSNLNLMVTVSENQTVDLRASQLAFLTNFAARTRTLTAIAEKEVAQQPLTTAENEFLQTIVDQNAGAYGVRVPGWYPRLFYNSWYVGPVLEVAPVVANVYTDVPAPGVGDPGGVLHEATGWANMLVIAIDSGPDRAVYAGPVSSHYEFYEPGTRRAMAPAPQRSHTASSRTWRVLGSIAVLFQRKMRPRRGQRRLEISKTVR